MVALNAKTGNVDGSERWLRIDDDSERQTENNDGYECQNWEAMMALNAKHENDDGFNRRNWVALNVETDEWWWLRTPRQEMSMALNVDWEVMMNAKLKIVMALNAKAEKR